MQVLSGNPLTANAFRVLGLSAGASQAEIVAAARRMRIWPRADQIPPTPWDMPSLGPIRRAANDIEQAFAQLNEPVSRIQHRLLWFATDGVHPGKDKIASPAAEQSSATAAHDSALLEVDFLGRKDPKMKRTKAWSEALCRLIQTAGDRDYQNWFIHVERKGDFEKRVADDEIPAVLDGLSESIAEDLSFRARDALDRSEFKRFNQAIIILNAVGPQAGHGERCLTDIANRVEDLLVSRSDRLCNAIHYGINWERQNWTQYISANKRVCHQCAVEIEKTVEPLLKSLDILEPAGGERHRRVAIPVSRMLRNLGLGWQRCREYRTADSVFRFAMKLAAGTPFYEKLKSDRKDVRKRIGLRKLFQAGTQTRTTTSGRAVGLVVIFPFLILRAILLVTDSSNTDLSPPQIQLPDFKPKLNDPSRYDYIPDLPTSRPLEDFGVQVGRPPQ